MARVRIPLWTVLLVALPALLLPAQERSEADPETGTTSNTWLQVSGLTEAQEPRVYDDLVVFSYEHSGYARYVAAAFEHENYQELHVFSVRELPTGGDLFYLAYPVDSGRDELVYRIIVDGIWMVDPHAPERFHDERGVALGRVALREPPVYRRSAPTHHPDGTSTFSIAFDIRIAATLETVNQRRVATQSFENPEIYVVGTFNGWDPFADRLQGPDEDGFYHLRRPMPPGEHYYYYLIDGRRVLDPLNRSQGRDLQTGALVSRTVVPPRPVR